MSDDGETPVHIHCLRYCTVCKQTTRQTRISSDDLWYCRQCGNELKPGTRPLKEIIDRIEKDLNHGERKEEPCNPCSDSPSF